VNRILLAYHVARTHNSDFLNLNRARPRQRKVDKPVLFLLSGRLDRRAKVFGQLRLRLVLFFVLLGDFKLPLQDDVDLSAGVAFFKDELVAFEFFFVKEIGELGEGCLEPVAELRHLFQEVNQHVHG